jgi:tetratricopeptide (TPR) repeat protein
MNNPAVKIFLSYAYEDETLRNALVRHLKLLENQGGITIWHDRKILPGAEWQDEIDQHLKSAEIILLLISSDFLDSEYRNGSELRLALERHKTKESRVIPVILRACNWQDLPIGKLKALPTDGKAITSWSNQDEAFTDVVKKLKQFIIEFKDATIVNDLTSPVKPSDSLAAKRVLTTSSKSTKSFANSNSVLPSSSKYQRSNNQKKSKKCAKKSLSLLKLSNYILPMSLALVGEVMLAFFLPHIWQSATAYSLRADIKSVILNNVDGALTDYSKAINIDPKHDYGYFKRSLLKRDKLNDKQGALTDLDQAIDIKPEMKYYYNRAFIKNEVNDKKSALVDYDQVIKFKSEDAIIYINRGSIKSDLDDTKGALSDFNSAIKINPKFSDAYLYRGILQYNKLDDIPSALIDINQSIDLDPKNVKAYYSGFDSNEVQCTF